MQGVSRSWAGKSQTGSLVRIRSGYRIGGIQPLIAETVGMSPVCCYQGSHMTEGVHLVGAEMRKGTQASDP